MRPMMLGLLVSLALLGATQECRASQFVSTKVILRIQPSWFELQDLFTDDANQGMIDSGYIYRADLKATYCGDADVTMENIKDWLESRNSYGVLEYGGHGSQGGSTGGVAFILESDADAEMARLIDDAKFSSDEIEVRQSDIAGFWLIMMKRAYTSSFYLGGCSVAFISTCYGSNAGGFNASCKVSGDGLVTNQGLQGSFSCLMGELLNPEYKTISDAADWCCNNMNNPFVAWSLTVSSGDWQLFPFDDPAATVYGFSVVDGVARWQATSLWETSFFMVEGTIGLGEPWHLAATDAARPGDHAVPVSGFTYYRLLEIERGGGTIFHGLSTDGRPAPSERPAEPTATFLKAQIERQKEKLLSSARAPKMQSGGKSMLIVTTNSLAPACQYGIARYWQLLGDTVRILTVDQYDANPDVKRAQIHSAIIDSVSHGTDCILLVGDANDYQQFDMTKQGPLWWPQSWTKIHDDFIASGWPPGGQPANDLIPAFYLPDTLPRGQNVAYTVPYVMTLSLYADVDGDSIPDVPWGCLPFTSESEVLGYANKLWAHCPTVSGARSVSFYIGDRDFDDVGDGALALDDARQLEAGLPPRVTVRELKVTDHPIDPQRNTEAANEYMQLSGIHVIIGAFSNRYSPGDFFDKTISLNRWSMNLISSYANYYPLGLWLSCGTADWARTEDPHVGLPIFHDFLASWDRGLLACIGASVGTWQHANLLIGKVVLQELYNNPSRPMAESFLIAIRHMMQEHNGERDITLAGRLYGFFGDPLARLNDIQVPTSVANTPTPARSTLEQNFPNPFNPMTTIEYRVKEKGLVKVKIYSVAGQLVRTLVDGVKDPGSYEIVWDGKNDLGIAAASGVYFYKMETTGFKATKKMVMLR